MPRQHFCQHEGCNLPVRPRGLRGPVPLYCEQHTGPSAARARRNAKAKATKRLQTIRKLMADTGMTKTQAEAAFDAISP